MAPFVVVYPKKHPFAMFNQVARSDSSACTFVGLESSGGASIGSISSHLMMGRCIPAVPRLSIRLTPLLRRDAVTPGVPSTARDCWQTYCTVLYVLVSVLVFLLHPSTRDPEYATVPDHMTVDIR